MCVSVLQAQTRTIHHNANKVQMISEGGNTQRYCWEVQEKKKSSESPPYLVHAQGIYKQFSELRCILNNGNELCRVRRVGSNEFYFTGGIVSLQLMMSDNEV